MTDEQPVEANNQERWHSHPILATTIRVLSWVVPVGMSVLTSMLIARSLPDPTSRDEAISSWIISLGCSTIVLIGVERVARRFLPLAALLNLSLLFPDRAPSRFSVALKSGTVRNLEKRVASARAITTGRTPREEAALVLELVAALNIHDRKTRGHAERVRAYTDLVAEEMGLSPAARDRLRWASLLHDIGKLAVPESVLNKPGKPTEEEWVMLRSHPVEGARLTGSLVGWLGEWGFAIEQHHEQWDGSGYPKGLSGEEISLAARIVAVTDAYEVMTAARSYKRPMSAEAARKELAHCAGTHFDPVVVRAFLNISLGKIRYAMGPLSWLMQLPFLSRVPEVGTWIAQTSHQTMATGVAVASFGTASVVPPSHMTRPPVEWKQNQQAAAQTIPVEEFVVTHGSPGTTKTSDPENGTTSDPENGTTTTRPRPPGSTPPGPKPSTTTSTTRPKPDDPDSTTTTTKPKPSGTTTTTTKPTTTTTTRPPTTTTTGNSTTWPTVPPPTTSPPPTTPPTTI